MTPISEDCPRHRAAWLGLGWFLVGAVVIGSLAPSGSLPDLPGWDKLQHLGAYALLAFVFAGALGRGAWKTVFLGLAVLGGGLELAQGAAGAGRLADGADLAANLLGAGLGIHLARRVPGGWCRRVEDWLAWQGQGR